MKLVTKAHFLIRINIWRQREKKYTSRKNVPYKTRVWFEGNNIYRRYIGVLSLKDILYSNSRVRSRTLWHTHGYARGKKRTFLRGARARSRRYCSKSCASGRFFSREKYFIGVSNSAKLFLRSSNRCCNRSRPCVEPPTISWRYF